MTFLIPYTRIEHAIHALAQQIDSDMQRLTTRHRYIKTLNSYQPVAITADPENVSLRFTPDSTLKEVLLISRGVTRDEVASELFVLHPRQQEKVRLMVTRALEMLEQTDSSISRYIHLLVLELFFCNAQQGGGSLVQNMGLVWFSPKKHWTVEYMAENIYHEALHQALFLEDMIYAVFAEPEVLARDEYFATSNFLKVKRPFDLVFHGAFVSTELVHFYNQHDNRKRVAELVPALKKSLKEMDEALARAKKNGDSLLTENGQVLYDRMHVYVTSLPTT